jgi:hypothetical protein
LAGAVQFAGILNAVDSLRREFKAPLVELCAEMPSVKMKMPARIILDHASFVALFVVSLYTRHRAFLCNSPPLGVDLLYFSLQLSLSRLGFPHMCTFSQVLLRARVWVMRCLVETFFLILLRSLFDSRWTLRVAYIFAYMPESDEKCFSISSRCLSFV